MKAIACFAILAMAAPAYAAEPRESLDTAIPDMIKLLEAKEFKKLIETYAAPETLKLMTANSSIDEVVKNFSGDKSDRLLKVLNAIKGMKPTMSENDTKATFELKEEIGGKKSILFVKVEKNWYIGN